MLAKALGLQVDETPDPEKLAADLKAAREEIRAAVTRAQGRERELTIELQLMRQAAKHGANPELLADSRTFMAKVTGLDPASDTFGEDLGDAIKAAVDANPAYKLTPPAAATPPATGSTGSGEGAVMATARRRTGPRAPRRPAGQATSTTARLAGTASGASRTSGRPPLPYQIGGSSSGRMRSGTANPVRRSTRCARSPR